MAIRKSNGNGVWTSSQSAATGQGEESRAETNHGAATHADPEPGCDGPVLVGSDLPLRAFSMAPGAHVLSPGARPSHDSGGSSAAGRHPVPVLHSAGRRYLNQSTAHAVAAAPHLNAAAGQSAGGDGCRGGSGRADVLAPRAPVCPNGTTRSGSRGQPVERGKLRWGML